ncbi:MAG: hypothetical protein AAGO57_02755 [Pseudomonadota bacterium]
MEAFAKVKIARDFQSARPATPIKQTGDGASRPNFRDPAYAYQ